MNPVNKENPLFTVAKDVEPHFGHDGIFEFFLRSFSSLSTRDLKSAQSMLKYGSF